MPALSTGTSMHPRWCRPPSRYTAARAAATIDRVKEISVIFTYVDGLTETYGPETVC
jgi:hypothetical protein